MAIISPKRGSAERRGGGAATSVGGGKGLELFTLGGVRLVRDGNDETAKLGAKHLALFVYLFHELRPMHPSEVIELLGRGQDEEKEIDGLQRAVAWLRSNIAGVNVRYSGETIEAIGGVRVDTADVDSAIDGGDARCVAELYVGEFLEGFESGCPGFDEWAQKERGRIKRAWSHAILSVTRDMEQRGRWDDSAEWWQVLVSRAPMRPEAVAGLLAALAKSGQKQEAARAYADYTARLKQSGVAQPADAVKQAVAEHPILRDVAEGRIKPPPPKAAVATPPPKPVAAPPPVIDAEPIAPKPAVTSEPVASAEPPPIQPPMSGKPAPEIDHEVVDGFEAGAPMPMSGKNAPPKPPPAKPAATPRPPPPEAKAEVPDFLAGGKPKADDEWTDFEEMAATGDFDIPITRPKPSQGKAEPKPADGTGAPGRKPTRKPVEEDEALRQAREAAAAFVDTGIKNVRHEVTSVRKAWAPVLKRWWSDTQPILIDLGDRALAALLALGRALLALSKVMGVKAIAAGGRISEAQAGMRERRRARKSDRSAAKADRAALNADKAAAKASAKAGKAAESASLKADKAAEKATAKAARKAEKQARKASAKEAKQKAAEPPPWETDAASSELDWDQPGAPSQVEPDLLEPSMSTSPFDTAQDDLIGVRFAETGVEERRRFRLPTLKIPALWPILRRFWYAPVALAVVGLAVVFGPRVVGMVGGLTEDLGDVQAPSLPSVSLPRVTVPKVTLRTPSFVETSVSRIAEMLSGPILDESGEWVLVADVDVADPGDGDPSSAAMTLALESDLAQARFFNTVPRERALIARTRRTGQRSANLNLDEALALAGAEGHALVIATWMSRGIGPDSMPFDSVRIQVMSPAGDTLYGVAAQVEEESNRLETMAGLARAVRRRLGEPGDDIEASRSPLQFLTSSPGALDAYTEARRHMYAGRFTSATSSAQQAVSLDPTFALAYQLLSEAYALRDQRRNARSALETAWELSDGTTDRERYRILADRHALEGRLSDAAVTYDELFQLYRDDVGALKAQALVQRMIGVRGSGGGNLRVAYSIDPYDWPQLSRIARYLNYPGRLPDVDSLVASLDDGGQ